MASVDYSNYPGESEHSGIHYSNLWYAPEEALRRQCKGCYQKYPILTRCIWVPLTFLTGTVKTLFFPLFAAVGVIALPIIAAVCFMIGAKTDNKEYYKKGEGWLKAWSWTLLAVAALGTVVVLHTYFLPLVASVTLILISIGISIAIHVYRALQDPPSLKADICI